jgi:SNF2 family DNA or RNA helicase
MRYVPDPFSSGVEDLTQHRHVCTSSLRVMKYHGSARGKNGHSFSNYDLVLSTYGTVSREFPSGNSPLYEAQWFRVVLDEGGQLSIDLRVCLLIKLS